MSKIDFFSLIKSTKKVLSKKTGFLKNKKKYKAVIYKNDTLHFFAYKTGDARFKACSINYKYEIDKLKEAQNIVEENNKKPNKKLSLLFFLINLVVLAVVLFISFTGDDALSLSQAFSMIKWPFLVIAFSMLIIALLIDSLKFVILIYQSTRRFRPFLAFKTMILGRYYDNITPSSTGGEPYQIYYMNKRGLKGEVATSVPLMKYISWQIGFVFTSFVFLMTNYSYLIVQNSLIVTLAWIGLAINSVLLIAVLLLSTSKKIGPAIVIGCLRLLSRMKIIKNYQSAFRKTMRFVFSYQRCMREFTSNFFYFIIQIILACAEIICSASIAYFVYLAFITEGSASFSLVVAITLLCNLAVCFIPIPGQAGAAEISFITVYGNLFTSLGPKVGPLAVVIYRLFSYYAILFIGVCVILYDFLIGNKKAEQYRKTHLFDGFVFKKPFQKMVRRKKNKKPIQVNEDTVSQNIEQAKKFESYETTRNLAEQNVEIADTEKSKLDNKKSATKNNTKQKLITEDNTLTKDKEKQKLPNKDNTNQKECSSDNTNQKDKAKRTTSKKDKIKENTNKKEVDLLANKPKTKKNN